MTPSTSESVVPQHNTHPPDDTSPFRVSPGVGNISTPPTEGDANGLAESDTEHFAGQKDITYWQGICLVVSREIGAGIFSTPSIVNGNAGSVGTALLIWFVAGCLSYAGARTPSPVSSRADILCLTQN